MFRSGIIKMKKENRKCYPNRLILDQCEQREGGIIQEKIEAQIDKKNILYPHNISNII